MGRYYSGDIEGKFWFIVQPSNAANRFGVQGTQNTQDTITYDFDKENLTEVNAELDRILNNLGDNKEKLDAFFEEHNTYTETKLAKFMCLDSENKLRYILREYADYYLGKQIVDCIKEKGYCSFDAEL